jgi:hypothetical protein
MTKNQTALFQFVLKNPGLTVAALRRKRGDCQAYESFLTARLFRLENKGLLWYHEKNKNGRCYKRFWYPVVP